MGPKSRVAVILAAAVVLLHASRAWAPFHLVVIDQVFLGTADCPNAQYVMMRMFVGGQTLVNGHSVPVQHADGSSAGEFGTFQSALSNGTTNAVFIMGTFEAAELFGLTMDQLAGGHLSVGSGRVCWDSFDCVAYGGFTGDNSPRGQPAESPPLGMALLRQTNTNNNAADFDIGAPAPRNNAGQVGTLGKCPSVGEPTATETVVEAETPTPTATSGTGASCNGDCNGDDRVLVNELVLGVAIALGQQPLSACPIFDLNHSDAVEVNELILAVNSAIAGCAVTPTPLASSTGSPPAPSATPTAAQGALGVRRFTINPEVSRLVGTVANGPELTVTGWQGFLELQAGVPDRNTGVAFIDVTDASEYLAIDAPDFGLALCIHVRRDQLPVQHAGIIACNGGMGYGVRLTQDHSIGVVDTCQGTGGACTGNSDCGGAECFTSALCTEAGGSVEGSGKPHQGVCNGPLDGMLDAPASPPGTVFIASDPNSHVINGIPVEIFQERSLPCGDEGATARVTALTLTSDHAIGRILDANNQPGETLEAAVNGEPFSCDTWSQENGPGMLVLSAPNLDTALASQVSDVIIQYVFAD